MFQNALQRVGVFIALALGLASAAAAQGAGGDAGETARTSTPLFNAEAQKVVDHVVRLRDRPYDHADWKPENGPWATYWAESYEDQLTDGEKKRYRQALDKGGCDVVMDFQTTTFLRKYSQLGPAHAQKNVAQVFDATVLAELPDDKFFKRWSLASRLLRSIKSNTFDVLPIDFRKQRAAPEASSMPNVSFGSAFQNFGRNLEGERIAQQESPLVKFTSDGPVEQRTRNTLCFALESLLNDAMEDDNKQTVLALLKLSKKTNVVMFTTEQLYAIYLRAEKLGVLPSEHAGDLVMLHHAVGNLLRMNIDLYLQDRKKNSMPYLETAQCQTQILSWEERRVLIQKMWRSPYR